MIRSLFAASVAVLLLAPTPGIAQLDKDQLALEIYRADTANTARLRSMIWKRHSQVSVNGELKLTTLTEFNFNAAGELEAKLVDAETTVKQKPGIRGRVQANAVEDKADYVQKALQLSTAYAFMTKGQLIDLFTKATVSEKDGMLEVDATDVLVAGDHVRTWYHAETKLPVRKWFASKLGADDVTGQLDYAAFESGVVHGTTTVLDMPAQQMKINAENRDYSARIQ